MNYENQQHGCIMVAEQAAPPVAEQAATQVAELTAPQVAEQTAPQAVAEQAAPRVAEQTGGSVDKAILITSHDLRQRLGGISTMTLWRWEQGRAFPKAFKIGPRKYWRLVDVMEWIDHCEAAA